MSNVKKTNNLVIGNVTLDLVDDEARELIDTLRSDVESDIADIRSDVETDISVIDARVDNLVTDVSGAETVTLWNGSMSADGGTYTLSESVSGFDFIDIYYDNANTGVADYLRIPASKASASVYIPMFETDLGNKPLEIGKVSLTFSGTSVTVAAAKQYFWDGTSASNATVLNAQHSFPVRIDGVRSSASVNAELADVRVGADGVTYGSAGAAVRGQITNVKDDFEYLRSNGIISFTMVVEEKGITESTGLDNNNSNYLRTKGYLFLNGKCTFVKKNGSIAYIFTYDSSGSKLSHKYLNASTDIYTFEAVSTNKYRISYGHSPAETMYLNSANEFAIYQENDTFARKVALDETSNLADHLSIVVNGGYTNIADNFILGDWEAENGVMVHKGNHKYRVTNSAYIEFPTTTTLHISDGYKVKANEVDSNYNNLGSLGWKTGSIDVYQNTKYLFMIGLDPEDTSVTADVETFSNAVQMPVQSINDRIDSILTNEQKEYNLNWNDEYYNGHLIKRCYNPYLNGGQLSLIGQLHCHTVGTGSGETQYATPSELCQYYKNNGYDFMTITDYSFISAYDGKSAHPDSMPSDFVWFTDSQEISVPSGNGRSIKHMCVYNAEDGIVYDSYASIQEIVDTLTKQGCFVSLAHPMWTHTYLIPSQLQQDTQHGLRFVEVYNGLAHSSGEEIFPTGKSTDFAWEALLDVGVYAWGIATSDSHPISNSAIKNGCVKVYSDTLTRKDIMKNLCEGNFYASTNVDASLESITFTDGVLTIDTGDSGSAIVFTKENGIVLKADTGAISSYSLTGDEKYVRVVVTLSTGEKIWTQPIINIDSNNYGYYN